MELRTPRDLFMLVRGQTVTKRNLYDLIQYSKVDGSPFWLGPELAIKNTPQQGINWIGETSAIQAVLIKARPGSYDYDGWSDDSRTAYHYSFKARNGEISYTEKANKVLIEQPQYLYPILLFTEYRGDWLFEGHFSVSGIEERFVILDRGWNFLVQASESVDERQYREGGRRYASHLIAERNKDVVDELKAMEPWVCDICGEDFHSKYGVEYIEAHHKVPISTYSSVHVVTRTDFVLLCPNCHKAVHIYMKRYDYEYGEIRRKLLQENGQ